MNMWSKVRTRAGALTLLAGVLTVGGTAGVVAVVSPASDQQPAGTVFAVPSNTPTATTTDAPAAVVEVPAVATPAPVAPPAAVAPPATVATVTTPAPKAAPATLPAPQVNPDGSLPEGWLPPKNPGEPPVAPVPPAPTAGPGAPDVPIAPRG